MAEQLVTQRYSSADSNQAGGFVFDVIGSNYYSVSKLAWGAVGDANYVALDAALPVQPGTGTTWAVAADALPLPTGAATEAKQDTAIAGLATIAGYVDGIEALLSTIEANQLADGHNVTIDNASLPVTGTFWQDTQPVSNAGTFAVQAAQSGAWAVTANAGTNLNTSALALESGGNLTSIASTLSGLTKTNGSVDTGTLRVTLADNSTGVIATVGQITQVVHVDDDGASLTVDGTVTAELSAADALVLGAIAAPVATIGATPLMRVAIFDDAANQITSFGGGGGGGTSAADDADFVAGTTSGTPAMGVYESAPSSVTNGDMGIVGITATRAMRVSVDNTVNVASHAVTNAGTFAVQAAQSGTWTVTGAGGTFPVTDSGGSLTVDDGGGSLTVDGTVSISGTVTVASHAVTNAGTFATQVTSVVPGTGATNLGKAEDAVHASGDTGVMALTVRTNTAVQRAGSDGDYAPLITDTDGRLHVNPGDAAYTAGAGAVTKVIAIAGQSSATPYALSCDSAGYLNTTPNGLVAHDGADSGNPLKIGAKATTSLSAKTMVANNDRTDLFAGVDGVLITRPHCDLEDIVTATPVAITDGSSTSVIAAQGATIKTYITSVTIANSSASFVTVDLRDGTGGAVKWTFPVPPSGGVTHRFDPPLPFSANTAVAADPSAAASTITVSLIGFKSKV